MDKEIPIAELHYFGRSSVKLRFANGRVVYIDPYAGEESFYKDPADLVLVTHQHEDHNHVNLVTLKSDAKIMNCPFDIHYGQSKHIKDFEIYAAAAYNHNHDIASCCGFVIQTPGFAFYHSGDTSFIKEMSALKEFSIDYAMLCMDGFYNMGPTEALDAARAIDAVHVLPMHTSKHELFDQEIANAFGANNKIIVKPGEHILLYPSK